MGANGVFTLFCLVRVLHVLPHLFLLWTDQPLFKSPVVSRSTCIFHVRGNGLVIFVTGFKMKKTVNSVWFLNLALADFLFTAFLIFSAVSLYQDHHWPFVTMFASVFFLTAISVDRCLSIWVVVWAQNNRTVFKAQIISAVIWLAAGICSTPYVCFRTIIEKNNVTDCFYDTETKNKWSLEIFRFIMGFLIPFLRFHRIVFSVVLAFFICWLPFHIFIFVDKSSNNEYLVQIGGPLIVCLAFINSCLNPILYVFICHDFQKKLKQSICHVLESALNDDHLKECSGQVMGLDYPQLSQ
uniref:G-protein coupled receptors family 1 profile domain-containing protein n=1 Tax=Cyprinodon variegatus TaxID=28743 RepID=A0A3Q2CSE1_CYPVA